MGNEGGRVEKGEGCVEKGEGWVEKGVDCCGCEGKEGVVVGGIGGICAKNPDPCRGGGLESEGNVAGRVEGGVGKLRDGGVMAERPWEGGRRVRMVSERFWYSSTF